MLRSQIRVGSLVKRFMMLSMCACVAALSMPPMAQQAPASSASDTPELQEIVVTGSMIKRVNAETAEAITILKADALKDLGITTVEQALDQLTANVPAVNIASTVGSFSGGGTYADLRGLGNADPGAARWPTAGPECLQRRMGST